MTIRFYLVPIEEYTRPSGTVFRGPRYFKWPHDPDPPALVEVVPEVRDFGLEPIALVAADIDTEQHSLLAAQSDVMFMPTNLDNTLGANLATVQATLEALHIPADTLTGANTYRQVLRGVMAVFLFAQGCKKRKRGVASGRLFPPGITLSTVLSDLSAQLRQNLQDAAHQVGFDYSELTLASTLRDVLKEIASQQVPGEMLGEAV